MPTRYVQNGRANRSILIIRRGTIAMKFLLTMAVSLSLMGNLCLAEEKPSLEDEKAKINYSVGYQIGDDFKRQGVEINPDVLVKGIQDALSGEKALMTPPERHTTLSNLKRKIAAQQKQEKAKQTREYPGEGREFLAENANKE